MRVLNYSDGWTRRHFLNTVGRGVAAAGVLAPLWNVISDTGTAEAAYPPELHSIEAYTRGKLKPGQELNADNVDIVKDLLDPIAYWEIKHDKRVVDLHPETKKIDELNPPGYIKATIRNKGVHHFGPHGNVWTKSGKPWIGGNPFPDPKNGLEAVMPAGLSWGRHDDALHPIKEWDTNPAGDTQYHYQFAFMEYQTVGRLVMDPKPYLTGHENELRRVPDMILAPEDYFGTAYLQIWPYNQHKFPQFYEYSPVSERVLSLPTNQRFEPLLPGEPYFATMTWDVGDPVLTWGNFKIVGRGPFLCGLQCPIYRNPGWLYKTCGGKSGTKYFRTWMQLVPEAIIVDYEPTSYPRAPISKKRTWFDARTGQPLVTNTYDRQGKLWQQWEGGFAWYDKADRGVDWPSTAPHSFWFWTHVHAVDIQSGRLARLQLTPEVKGGHKLQLNNPALWGDYCSLGELRRMGAQ